VHFHSIGAGLATSESNFRAALDLLHGFEDGVWIAGVAQAFKYQAERTAARLELRRDGGDRLILSCSFQTDPNLYDQPLTLRVTLRPGQSLEQLSLIREGREIPRLQGETLDEGAPSALFDVPPTSSDYMIEGIPVKDVATGELFGANGHPKD
jgi:hypothetical protein